MAMNVAMGKNVAKGVRACPRPGLCPLPYGIAASNNVVRYASSYNNLFLLDKDVSSHICQSCQNPMHVYCVYGPGGRRGGAEYEGYDGGGICKPCLLKMSTKG